MQVWRFVAAIGQVLLFHAFMGQARAAAVPLQAR
jgi:hypothetical protein